MTDIVFNPILPWPVLSGFGAVVVILAILSLVRARASTWFRLPACLLVLAGLSNPEIMTQDTRSLNDIALVLVDRSPSQSIAARRQETEKALRSLQEEAAHYHNLELRIIPLNIDGKEDKLGTRAFGPLRQALAGIDPARYGGSILISDGQIHDIAPNFDLPGPFHVLLSGQKQEKDRRVEIIDAPRYSLVDDVLTIRARVLDNGHVTPQAPLKLITPEGMKLDFRPKKNGLQEVTHSLNHPGPSIFVVESESLEGEISQTNNRAVLSINGVRDRLRVLLVSGLPHQGQRTWRNILRSDPAVDLVHFTILRPSEKEDFTPLNELSLIAFPVRELFEEKLKDFDLIIFDRYHKHNVLSDGYFNNINEYVQGGGAILISAGPSFSGGRSLAKTSLSTILPLQPTGQISQEHPYHLKRTPTGKRHPITARLERPEKDWGRWMRLIEADHVNGQTILQDDQDNPLLVVEHVGNGRLAILLSDQLWLWARGFDGGGPHTELVRNLVHWLMKEPELEEERLSMHVLSDNRIEVQRQSLSPSPKKVTITYPDESEEELSLKKRGKGVWGAEIKAVENGIYRAKDNDFQTLTTKGSLNPVELIDPRASEEPLRSTVEKSGGTIHWLTDGMPTVKRISPQASAGGRGWLGLTRNQAKAVIGIRQSPLLPPWLLFLFGASLWAAAWWRESR